MHPTRPDPATADQVWTLTRLASEFSTRLDRDWPALWVRGELSGHSRHASSGHHYFTLKDSQAQFSAVMWRSRADASSVQPASGMQVEALVRLVFYPPQGRLQLDVQRLRASGRGDMMQALLDLKEKLAAEGLFDPSRKRPLPAYPWRIGLLTAHGGAALQDMLKILSRRWPQAHCFLLPVPVQGAGAGAALEQGLRRLSTWPGLALDLIILGRGGGSFEDLYAFNDEGLVRAIAACPVPVISAVGHEIDTTLSDYAADLRAPTPSAAAELAVPEAQGVMACLDTLERRLDAALRARLTELSRHLAALRTHRALARPEARLGMAGQRLDELEARMRLRSGQLVAGRVESMERLARRLRVALQRLQGEAALRVLDWPRRLELPLRRRLREEDARTRLALGSMGRSMRVVLDTRAACLTQVEGRLERLEQGRLHARMLRMGFLLARDKEGRPLATLRGMEAGSVVQLEFHGGEAEAQLLSIKEQCP